MPITIFNTATHEKELFVPILEKEVGMYTCGPTVYDYAHIGNLRSYIFADILRKTLKYNGYNLKQVMNITDIGHLASDADSGDDKMTKGLLREGKELNLANMRTLAEFYTNKFKDDLKDLNIELPDVLCFASDYIKEDIELIQRLEQKGFVYKTNDGIYFDISKMPDYGILTGGKKDWNENNTRININPEKKNPEDFALWKFNNTIGFESPFGMGFPGWHIECSAMSMKFLGEQFDIHTGGIDHIPVHHTNEIAQSESATGKKPFVKYWLHHEFLDMSGDKMAKSNGNYLRIIDLKEKINPITYRFWILMASYHTKMNFNWDALNGAETALGRLYHLYLNIGTDIGEININYQEKFKGYINDDLDTPRALTVLWDLIKDENISNADKKATVLDFDKVLGLGFENLEIKDEIDEIEIPENIELLLSERKNAKEQKDFQKSDKIRAQINSLGYEVKDSPDGQKLIKT
ncbi:MAG: cysteine--tRNA ligase [bacterium]|nr:cysteine--tRNA ligase [bacterium]